MNIWQLVFIQPLANVLILLLHLLFNNLGLAIIALTIFVRLILVPLTVPSQRAMAKMRDLAPEIEKLKKRHKGDKTKLMQAQADLYKVHGVNPAAGCLPQIIQLLILFGLLGVFNIAIKADANTISELNKMAYPFVGQLESIVTKFLYLDLVHPDSFPVSGLPFNLPGVLLIAAAIVQLLSAKMMMTEVKKEKQIAKKTSGEMDDIMASSQQQMLYLFPVMTIIVGINFPSGLVLYWFIFSLSQMVQQYYTSGWGGLTSWLARLNLVQSPYKSK